MQFFISYKSFAYRIVKSPINPDWAFLMNYHVPRLLIDQCSTGLLSQIEQSHTGFHY
jgi:hypothetical protein